MREGLLLILVLRLVNKLERAVFFDAAIIASCASDALLIFGVAGTFACRALPIRGAKHSIALQKR